MTVQINPFLLSVEAPSAHNKLLHVDDSPGVLLVASCTPHVVKVTDSPEYCVIVLLLSVTMA